MTANGKKGRDVSGCAILLRSSSTHGHEYMHYCYTRILYYIYVCVLYVCVRVYVLVVENTHSLSLRRSN